MLSLTPMVMQDIKSVCVCVLDASLGLYPRWQSPNRHVEEEDKFNEKA